MLREILRLPKTPTSSSTTPMQISSTLTDSQQRVTTNSSSERARDNKNGGKKELQQFTITKYKQKAVEQTLLDYLDRFEEKARKALLKLCTDYHTLNGKLLESQDITDYWHSI